MVDTPNRVEAFAKLLTEYGIEFQTQETAEGTRFVYALGDFELGARLYAEVQAREIQRRNVGTPQQ